MAITIDGKIYRNLQEQVLYLTDQFNELKPTDYKAGNGINITNDTISADSTIQRKPTAIDYPHGGPSSLTYDTADGIAMEGSARLTTAEGTQDVPLTTRIPIKPGSNITIDADSAGEFIIVSASGGGQLDVVEIDAVYDSLGDITDAATIAKLQKPGTVIMLKINEDDDGNAQYSVLTMFERDYDGSTDMYARLIYSNGLRTLDITVQDEANASWEASVDPAVQPVYLTIPASATQGTITAAQLATLQNNDQNYIVINDTEIYLLQDKGHTTGIWTYTHEGYEGGGKSKYLNLTIATRAYTIVTSQYETSTALDITLLTTGWSQDGDLYTYVATATGVKSTDNIIIDLNLDGITSATTCQAAISDYAKITAVEAGANVLLIRALEVPTDALNIHCLIVR